MHITVTVFDPYDAGIEAQRIVFVSHITQMYSRTNGGTTIVLSNAVDNRNLVHVLEPIDAILQNINNLTEKL